MMKVTVTVMSYHLNLVFIERIKYLAEQIFNFVSLNSLCSLLVKQTRVIQPFINKNNVFTDNSATAS